MSIAEFSFVSLVAGIKQRQGQFLFVCMLLFFFALSVLLCFYFPFLCFFFGFLGGFFLSPFLTVYNFSGFLAFFPALVPLCLPRCLCSALPFIEPEHAEKTRSSVHQSMSGIMGKKSWCRGLEFPDLFPVESVWSVRNGRGGEQWDQNGVILDENDKL
jgi:hypothetical protein